MPTFLACWRFFSLRGCGEAARERLGGNLRVKGKEKKKSAQWSFNPPPLRKDAVQGEGQIQPAKGKVHATECRNQNWRGQVQGTEPR